MNVFGVNRDRASAEADVIGGHPSDGVRDVIGGHPSDGVRDVVDAGQLRCCR
jgi:hypothetical protein